MLTRHIKAILYAFKQTYCKGYSIKSVNESTTVKDGILPFLESYYPNNKRYTTFSADKEILESKKRFIDIDPALSKRARKGDFSIVTNQSKHLIFALESKPERKKGRSKEDVTKMARYMKDALDSIESEKNVLKETIVELSTLKHERNSPSSLKKLKTYHSPTQLPGSRVKRVCLTQQLPNIQKGNCSLCNPYH